MDGLKEGRIVYYVKPDNPQMGISHLATVGFVKSHATGECDLLCVVREAGQKIDTGFVVHNVLYDPNQALGTWHWIEEA